MYAGQQFAEGEPVVYQAGGEPYGHSAGVHDNLLPKYRTKKIGIISGIDDLGEESGAVVDVHGPKAFRYEKASYSDPGALFSIERPKIDNLYSTRDSKHVVPAALGLAHKHSVERWGMAPTHSGILTPFSHRIVEKSIKSGDVVRNQHYDSESVAHANERGAQMEHEQYSSNKGELSQEELIREYKDRIQEDSDIVAKENLYEMMSDSTHGIAGEEGPPGTYEEASKYARNLLRKPKPEPEKPSIHPDQMRLF